MRLQVCPVDHREAPAVLAPAERQFLSIRKRRDEVDEVLEADARVRDDLAVYLERLTEHLTPRDARERLSVDG
jgi:hypothetical protein